jgi:hypothetical protein
VAYGCFGRRAQWLTAGSCLLALLLGVTLSPSWLFWLAFVSVLLSMFGWRHPPVEDEAAPLGTTRWMIALLALAIFVFCFVPVPISELLPRS